MFNRDFLEKLNDNEMRIYNFLLRNDIDSLSVRDVAKETFASPASVIRMAKKLGYSGFTEFIFELKKYRKRGSGNQGYAMDIRQEGIFIIRDEAEVERFIDSIHSDKLLVYAEGFSEIVSSYIYKKLVVLGKDVTLFHGIDYEMIGKNPFKKQPYGAAIIISKSGENPYCIKFAEHMKREGLKVHTFTGNCSSTLSKIADVSFTYEDPYKHDRDIFYPNPFFGYLIVGFEELMKLYFKKYMS